MTPGADGTAITSANHIAALNPLRYRGYYYDTETGWYYLQSRYYNPTVGRFLNADAFASTGQGFLGYNMFAYCGNDPISNNDPSGQWTVGLSDCVNITLFITVSVSVGIFFDSKGNADLQWSYSAPKVDDTLSIGVIDAGIGRTVQITNRDTVYDLYGKSTVAGVSGGDIWYAGGDVISFSEPSDIKGFVDGVQVNIGAGVGFDAHIGTYNTRQLNIIPQKFKTFFSKATRKISDAIDKSNRHWKKR